MDAEGKVPRGEVAPSTYNFHGLFSVGVTHRGLDSLMRRELDVFLDDMDEVDLTVEEGEVSLPERMLSLNLSFSDSSFVFETSTGRIQLTDGRLRAETSVSPRSILVQWVESLMRQRITMKGVCFVHASAVSRKGTGYLFPAWSHTGKTNVAIRFLVEGYDHMADDWCFVSSTGEILGYPRWLSLYAHNFAAHPFLRTIVGTRRERLNLRRRLAVTKFARSLHGADRISEVLRHRLLDRFFVNVRIPAQRVIPGCKVALRAPLSKVCLLTTARSGETTVSDVSGNELARKVALCCNERNRFSGYRAAMAYAGHDVMGDLISEETNLLGRAFETAKCVEVTLPQRANSGDLDHVQRLLEEA